MAGGLMQLVAYGAQDIYLTGNPLITYFKVVYRRHTNFASESIEQTFNGAADFGRKVSCIVARNGDLVNRMTLEAVLPAVQHFDSGSFKWVDDIGNYLVSEVNIEIGGQEIDKHYGDWLNIWTSLTVPEGLRGTYNKMIGNYPIWDRQGTAFYDTQALNVWNQSPKDSVKLYIPLQFWCNRNVGLSLPLIALQYHEVKINLTIAPASTLHHLGKAEEQYYSSLKLESLSLWIDYVFLDTDERRRFAQVSHEYLIEQLQVNSSSFSTVTATQQVKLTFNHPVKALYWYAQDGNYLSSNWLSNWTDRPSEMEDDYYSVEPVGARNPVKTSKLQLNGHDRYAQRDGTYFSLVENFYHNSGGGRYPGLNQYNFALKPEEHQPSGSCNFSRIDNATLSMTLQYADGSAAHSGNITVYAVNYNVLRIMSGMGGLAYSN